VRPAGQQVIFTAKKDAPVFGATQCKAKKNVKDFSCNVLIN
jgi:hypothetical protein